MNVSGTVSITVLLIVAAVGCLPLPGITHRVAIDNVGTVKRYQPYYEKGQFYTLMLDSTLSYATNKPQIKETPYIHPSRSNNGIDMDFLKMRADRKDEWFVQLVKDKPDPKGVLVRGTVIEIVQILKFTYKFPGDDGGESIVPIGQIVVGPYQGVKVQLDGLSLYTSNGEEGNDRVNFLEPNPEYLTESPRSK